MPDVGIQVDMDEAAGDEHDNDQAVDEQKDDLQRGESAQVRQSMQDLSSAAVALAERVEQVRNQADIQLEQLPLGGAEARDNVPDRNAQIEELRIAIRQELRGQQQGTVLNSVTARWALALLSVVGTINAIHAIYGWLKTSDSANPHLLASSAEASTAVPVDAPVVKAAWLVDEPTFWNRYADYASKTGIRPYPEQLLFMKFTEDLSAHMLPQMFEWDSSADKLLLINSLVTELKTNGLAAAYLAVANLRYKGQPLPRTVSANVMSFALASWASQQKASDV